MALSISFPTNGGGTDTTLTNVFTTGSISFIAGRLYVIGVLASSAAGSAESPSVVGSGTGTWTAVTGGASVSFDTVASSAKRLNCQYVVPSTNATETLTITYATNRLNCLWIVIEITGQDSSWLVQADTGRDDAKTSVQAMVTNALTLASFGDATNNGLLMFVGVDVSTGITEAGSLTELRQQTDTVPNATLAAYYQIGEDTTPDATFGSADVGAIAMEIKASASVGQSTSSRARVLAARRRRRL